MMRLLAAIVVALAATSATAADVAEARDSDTLCGPAGNEYRCGSILVILEEAATDSIEAVIERMGGDPATDVLDQFRAVRDLLDPDGVADDMSEALVYSIAVPVDDEEAMATAYAADPAVYAAAVDRETIGQLAVPDTAINNSSRGVVAAIGVLLVIASSAAAFGRQQRRHEGARSPQATADRPRQGADSR